MFFAYPVKTECEMNMHVVVSQDQQLAKPAGALKLTVLEVPFENDILQFNLIAF